MRLRKKDAAKKKFQQEARPVAAILLLYGSRENGCSSTPQYKSHSLTFTLCFDAFHSPSLSFSLFVLSDATTI